MTEATSDEGCIGTYDDGESRGDLSPGDGDATDSSDVNNALGIYEAVLDDFEEPSEPTELAFPHDFLIPYDASDDDSDDLSLIDETDFVDSGWDAECLQDLEDIDFEFVYALHTFVATVEGQANATKGDTMVLLDDSNSYWWLVRVVKDSSIGMYPRRLFAFGIN